MRIAARYSHLNGLEYMLVHHKNLWGEIQSVIANVDAEACKTKKSKEKTMRGRLLYSPKAMNDEFKVSFENLGWNQRRQTFYVTDDERLMRAIYNRPDEEQKVAIDEAGQAPIMSYNQTDFVKNRIAVEVQFGKYAFVAHDLFVKHLSFYVADIIDVGIEILPMKEMERDMSSGVPYYERDLVNVIRQGRGVPAVPLILLGVMP
ncbi:MAG: BglII/BstYI family type II restriction endonuclease [Chloroflexota bacterium]|nr:BglII/BstYI family type II restriction endonuclease [Chloroflexota bacterium]MDE2854452.1 BglII/BstYI family type II restriction endonuclease [Chloroflexota bacterium]MDE2946726.1 BglII/BstYI family type II restriction endonuclease [Chloroflexota bacterium]